MSKDLKDKVQKQLEWDSRIDAKDVDVELKGKKIRLKGKVPSLVAKTAATVSAYSVAGGHQVENKLEVAYPKDFKVPSDDEITDRIRTSLGVYQTIDESDIEIVVDKGIVNLKGSVDAFWKKQRAEQVASTISGVREIKNHLSVVPTDDVVDEKIADSVVKALERDSRIEADKIDVSVEDGVVTIRGDVPDWAGYAAALYCAANTVAVKNVMTNLTVQGGVVDTIRTLFEM
jgi:osmotically-inducible protein OsmY